MGIINELDAAIGLTVRERRQLRLAHVETAVDLYAFYQANPDLVQGRKQSTVPVGVVNQALRTWRAEAAAPSTTHISTAFNAAAMDPGRLKATRGPGETVGADDPAARRYLSVLDFAWERLPLDVRAIALHQGEWPEPATGAAVRSTTSLRVGTKVPYRVLASPPTRLSFAIGPVLGLDLGVSLDDEGLDLTIRVHGADAGRAPTPVAAPGGPTGDGWDDVVVAIPPLGDTILLDHPSWDVRDQGTRGTCTAFAVVASAEHRLAVLDDLSEESLFDAVAGFGAAASTLADMAPDANPVREERDHAYGSPPVPAPAGLARPFPAAWIDMPAARDVYAQLAAGRAPAIALPVWRSPSGGPSNWNTLAGRSYGHVLSAPAGAVMSGAHAVCVVGYTPTPSGGYFVFRNSWGPGWGALASPAGTPPLPRPGYGYVHASYLHNYALELRTVTGAG